MAGPLEGQEGQGDDDPDVPLQSVEIVDREAPPRVPIEEGPYDSAVVVDEVTNG